MAHEATSREQICCPHCLAEYNLSDAKPDYIHSIKGFDEIFYVALCYDCRRLMQPQRKMEKKHTVHRIGLNIFSNPDKCLSVTTEVAMVMNDHSFSDALQNGHGLTRAAYDAVKRGDYSKLPFSGPGLMIIWD
tara:strand:- start:36 stop:434 length:399 start_codon:yes stop_codon:yes gene_type:complete